MSALQATWFGLIGVLLVGYIILDGYDLGVGFWHLFSRKEGDRRALLASILPYWDGNEVWLLTAGGAVFAAFPEVYATVFSGMYLALMIVLAALIFRAVAIEFMNQSESERWKRWWGTAFGLGSSVPALLFGVAMGNILRGVPLDANKNFTGTFFTLLNPYSLLIGLAGLAMFATHGGLWSVLKTGGEFSEQMRAKTQKAWAVYVVFFVTAVAVTITSNTGLLSNYRSYPVLWALPVIALVAILAVGHFNHKKQALKAFLASSFAMLSILLCTSAGLFPNMVPAINDPALSLTIMNSSSSPLTLKTMFIVALIGVPLVLAYTVWVHRIFLGKADSDMSY